MKKNRQIIGLIGAYFALRLFSFFYLPGSLTNSIVSALILSMVFYFLIKQDIRGWLIIGAEIILGGVGGFLSVGQISLRTLLLILTILVFTARTIKSKTGLIYFKNNRSMVLLILTLSVLAGLSGIMGLCYNHDLKLIFADVIPYLFLLYYFALKAIWPNNQFKSFVKNAIGVAIFGNLMLVLGAFVFYSSGWGQIHDQFYSYWRDVAGGKITDLENGFFRITLNEHLILIPLLLSYLYDLINKVKSRQAWLSAVFLLIILSINITRIYILALVVGLIVLFSWRYWKRWLVIGLSAGLLLIASFSAISLMASHGQTLGWELFGVRLQSFVNPRVEPSALSRMLLLPKIFSQIKTHWFLGNGLGSVVTVFSPVTGQEITTPNFDWGYLEIWAEMGLIGLLAWLGLIIFVLKSLWITKNRELTAVLLGLIVINITSPALFHVLGVVCLVCLMVKLKEKI